MAASLKVDLRTPDAAGVGPAPAPGEHDVALRLAENATRTYRRLARARPEMYLLDLVRALTDEGRLKSYTDWESAVAPAQEAARIYRQLTATRIFVPELAGSLSNLLAFLWEMATDASSPRLPSPEGVGNL
jgi:hypothetical protein